MIRPLIRAELWTDYRCRSGSRIGILPFTRDTGSCVVSHKRTDQLLAVREVTLTCPDDWEYADQLTRDMVIALVYIDNSTADGAFEEYRIEHDESGTGEHAGRIKILALDPIHDLAREEESITAQPSGDITQNLTTILTYAPSIFVAGTVTPTHGCQLNLTGVMPIDALRQLMEFANESADFSSGQQYLARSRRNGTTDYRIDIIELGTSADLPDIRERKNLQSLLRRRTRQDVFTRLEMTAQGQPLGDAWFTVTAVTVNTSIDIEVDGFSALNPIYKDGAYAAQGLYWFHEDGVAHAITNESRANKRLFMASTTGIAVGERGRFARNSAGDPVLWLDDPDGSRPILRKKDFNVSPGMNWVDNARLENWTGGVPDDWAEDGADGLWTEEDTVTLFGGAAHFTPNVGSQSLYAWSWSGVPATSGRTVYCRAGDTITYRIWARAEDYNNGIIHVMEPNVTLAQGIALNGLEAPFTETEKYLEWSRSFVVETAGDKRLYIRLFGQTNEWYCGGAVVTITPRGAVVPTGFFEGSPGARAWVQAVNMLLGQGGSVYQVTVLDLSRYDDATWPFDRLELGADVRLTSALQGGSELLKVVQLDVNELNLLDSKITLASRWQTLTSQLFGALLTFTGPSASSTVGIPVNTEPDEPPLPPPPPAPIDAAFAMVAHHGSLTLARQLVAGTNITLTDGGPGSTLTIEAAASGFAPSFLAAYASSDITHTNETAQPVEYDTTAESSGSGLSLSSGDIVFAVAGVYLVNAACYFTVPETSGTATQFELTCTATNTVGNDLEGTWTRSGLEQDAMAHVTGLVWVETDAESMQISATVRWSGSPGSLDSWGHRILVCGPLLEL